jgi:hypothetical protein
MVQADKVNTPDILSCLHLEAAEILMRQTWGTDIIHIIDDLVF